MSAMNPKIANIAAPIDPKVNNSVKYSILEMLADVNGCSGYAEDKAAMGTIPSAYRLKFSYAVPVPKDFTPGKSPFENADQFDAFVALNYVALTTAQPPVQPNTAAFLTMLRAMVVNAGYVATDLTARAIYVDEYDYNVPMPKEAVNVTLTQSMVKFIADNWETIVAVVAHVFQVRGHHYKSEYQRTYDRTWRSTTIEIPVDVQMPTWQEISTIGLHPFGVRALHLVREDASKHGRLARSLVIRRDAAYAGSAPVRTTAAALMEMAQAKWWNAFYKRYQHEIESVLKQASDLKLAGPSSHINAKLYHWDAKFIGIDETSVQVVAPYVLGWIDTLGPDEAITQQKAINKRGQGGSAIRTAFAAVIANEQRNDRSYSSVAEFLAQ